VYKRQSQENFLEHDALPNEVMKNACTFRAGSGPSRYHTVL